MNKKLRVFEAFAGVGSQRMALRNLGIDHEVVGISEIDKYALKSYEAIHGDCPNYGDISKLSVDELPDMDLFTYSFPCQDLSVAGKQEGLKEGTRSGLLYECERIIEGKRPKYLLLENVKNLVGKKFKADFEKWLSYLERLGYTNYWRILNAKDFGIPQNRERVFVISILDDKSFEFPQEYTSNKRLEDILEYNVEEKYYVNTEKAFAIIEKIKEEKNILFESKRLGGMFDDKIKRQAGAIWSVKGLSPTLDTMQGGYRQPCIIDIIHKNRIRKLTPLECWRLMGFDDEDFNKAKNAGLSNSQLYKQAGNSIVVPVLEGIFRELFLK